MNKEFAIPIQNIEELRQKITNELNVLQQQPEIIRNAVHQMHIQTIICAEQNEGHINRDGP